MAVWSWQTDAEALVHGGTDIMCRSSSGLPTREKRGDPESPGPERPTALKTAYR